jgi:hypothetical protein
MPLRTKAEICVLAKYTHLLADSYWLGAAHCLQNNSVLNYWMARERHLLNAHVVCGWR